MARRLAEYFTAEVWRLARHKAMGAAKPLHVATSLKIVAKYTHVAKPSIMVVRDRIQRLAVARVTREDQLLAEDLGEATGPARMTAPAC